MKVRGEAGSVLARWRDGWAVQTSRRKHPLLDARIDALALLSTSQKRLRELLRSTGPLLYSNEKCVRVWQRRGLTSRPHVDGSSPWLMKIGPLLLLLSAAAIGEGAIGVVAPAPAVLAAPRVLASLGLLLLVWQPLLGSGWWSGGRGHGRPSVAGGGSQGRHSEFLQEQIIAGLQKSRKRTSAAKVKPNGFETAIETAQEIEDKSLVVDGLAEVADGVCHALDFPAVRSDVEVALLEVAKGGVEAESTSFAIAVEL